MKLKEIATAYAKMNEMDLHHKFYYALPVGSKPYRELHSEIVSMAEFCKANAEKDIEL